MWNESDRQKAKERVQREIQKRKNRGEPFEVVTPPASRNKLSTTFWGQAWCRNLESYQEYDNRLPRGRSYLRQGNVYNLTIEQGRVTAVVAGAEMYDAEVIIRPLSPQKWQDIAHECAGQLESVFDLLSGKIGDGVMKVLTDPDKGLFPKPKEIRFNCSCPDYADMCKHVSAMLYGVGVLLDSKPELLFTLRGVDKADLISNASEATITTLNQEPASSDLEGVDLSALFGIDLSGEDDATRRSESQK